MIFTFSKERKAILFFLSILGFVSLVSQVVLLREVLVVFYGNELTIGFTLASWLFWGGMGALLFYFSRSKKPYTISVTSIFMVLCGIIPIIELLFLRSMNFILLRKMGEIAGLSSMVLASFVGLAPLSLMLGFQFANLMEINTKRGFTPAIAYSAEASGSFIGGCLFYLLLARSPTHLDVLFIVAMLDLFLVSCILILSRRISITSLLLLAAAALIVVLSFFGTPEKIEHWSQGYLWRGFKLIEHENTVYGDLAVVKDGSQTSIYENGLLSWTYPDREGTEPFVHIALAQLKNPKRILVVGGGPEVIEEALKHKPFELEYIEFNPVKVDLMKKFVRSAEKSALNSVKVKLRSGDARFILRNEKGKFDLILCFLPDPYNASINRLYTTEFYSLIGEKLKDSGFFATSIFSSENYLGGGVKKFDASIINSLRAHFKKVSLFPGERMLLLASNSKICDDGKVLWNRIESSGIEASYLNYSLTVDRANPYRIARAVRAFGNDAEGLNRDTRPVSYYLNSVLWSNLTGSKFASLASVMYGTNPVEFLIVIALISLLCSIWSRRMSSQGFTMHIFTTGFTGLSLQFLILIGVQTAYGNVYSVLALVITSFMLGLALGGVIFDATPLKKIYPLNGARLISSSLIAITVSVTFQGGIAQFAPQLVMPLFLVESVLTGFLVACAYPVALSGAGRLSQKSFYGWYYGFDLMGGALAGLFLGGLIYPLFGITVACAALVVMNLAILIGLGAVDYHPLH